MVIPIVFFSDRSIDVFLSRCNIKYVSTGTSSGGRT